MREKGTSGEVFANTVFLLFFVEEGSIGEKGIKILESGRPWNIRTHRRLTKSDSRREAGAPCPEGAKYGARWVSCGTSIGAQQGDGRQLNSSRQEES